MKKAGEITPTSAELIRIWKLAYPKLTEEDIDATLDTKDYHVLVWSKGKVKVQLTVLAEDLKTLTPEELRNGGAE